MTIKYKGNDDAKTYTESNITRFFRGDEHDTLSWISADHEGEVSSIDLWQLLEITE